MEKYKNRGNSGVQAFEIGHDFIYVLFEQGPIYKYSYKYPGPDQVEEMKRLAREGKGLATFISQEVKGHYEKRLKELQPLKARTSTNSNTKTPTRSNTIQRFPTKK